MARACVCLRLTRRIRCLPTSEAIPTVGLFHYESLSVSDAFYNSPLSTAYAGTMEKITIDQRKELRGKSFLSKNNVKNHIKNFHLDPTIGADTSVLNELRSTFGSELYHNRIRDQITNYLTH